MAHLGDRTIPESSTAVHGVLLTILWPEAHPPVVSMGAAEEVRVHPFQPVDRALWEAVDRQAEGLHLLHQIFLGVDLHRQWDREWEEECLRGHIITLDVGLGR